MRGYGRKRDKSRSSGIEDDGNIRNIASFPWQALFTIGTQLHIHTVIGGRCAPYSQLDRCSVSLTLHYTATAWSVIEPGIVVCPKWIVSQMRVKWSWFFSVISHRRISFLPPLLLCYCCTAAAVCLLGRVANNYHKRIQCFAKSPSSLR